MILSADASSLSLNGNALPGIFDGLSVGSKLLMDAKAVEGGSGKQYQVNGFDDASVSFSLRLLDDGEVSKEEALADIAGRFKKFNKDGMPVIYTLDFPQAHAWNLQGCLFVQMDSSQSTGKQEIKVNLKFAEHRPEIAVIQQQKQNDSAQQGIPEAPSSPVFTDNEASDIQLGQSQ